MLSFTTAHVAVVALRIKDPDRAAALPGALERAHPGQHDPAHRRARRHRHVRRLVLGRRAARRGPRDRAALDGLRDDRLLPLPPAPGPRPVALLPDRAPGAPARLRRARVPHRARPDLRRRRIRRGAPQRRQADRRGGRRVRRLRAARPQPALARGGPRGGGGARALGAGERAHPGAAEGHQDPHRADPHAQPRLGARRGSRARRLRRRVLVGDPRAARRAAHRPDRGLPAEGAPVPDHHRDRQPRRRSRQRRRRAAGPEPAVPAGS